MFLVSTGAYLAVDRSRFSQAWRNQQLNHRADFARHLSLAQSKREEVPKVERKAEEDGERWDGLA